MNDNIEKKVHVDKSIVVDVPVRVAYDQWTQYETFPEFMEGVEPVSRLDEERLHWKAKIGGVTREWDAEILDNIVDQQVAWRSSLARRTTALSRSPVIPTTRCPLRSDCAWITRAAGVVEKTGDLLGIVERRAKGDLVRFKHFMESRGTQIRAGGGDESKSR